MKNLHFLSYLLISIVLLVGCKESNETSSTKVVGGQVMSQGTYQRFFKSVASLQIGGRHFCGGTLIAPNRVLTAAHCVEDMSNNTIANRLQVVLGTTSISSRNGAEVLRVTGVQLHPRFDAAILNLASRSTMPVAPINENQTAPTPGTNTFVAGWGVTRENGNISRNLKFAQLRVVSNRDCSRVYGRSINEGTICAYADGADACQGDSGGPLFSFDGQKLTVVGVVSFGRGCARPNIPGVYARVSALFDGN